MEIVSVGSSSSGNSYIIMAGGRTIILDVGLPCKKIMAALEHLGIDPYEVDAVLITHDHIDHVKSVRAVARKCCNAVFYASRGTVESAEGFRYVPEERLRIISAGDTFYIGAGITVSAFRLSHDAREPIGFTVGSYISGSQAEDDTEKLAVVTDTGIITDEIFEAIKDADLLVFESNHDEQMLMFGEYPYPLKMRIKGEHGHLSNAYAGEVLTRILDHRRTALSGRDDYGPLRIMLAHLSFHNNMPLFARQTVEDALHANGFVIGEDYVLDVAAKEGFTFMPSIRREQ